VTLALFINVLIIIIIIIIERYSGRFTTPTTKRRHSLCQHVLVRCVWRSSLQHVVPGRSVVQRVTESVQWQCPVSLGHRRASQRTRRDQRHETQSSRQHGRLYHRSSRTTRSTAGPCPSLTFTIYQLAALIGVTLVILTQLNFIKNCSLKAGLNEQRTHENYKNTKLHIARLNRETNKRKHKKKQKTQWSGLIIFGSIDYKTTCIAKSRGACHRRFKFFSGTEMNKEHPLEVGVNRT